MAPLTPAPRRRQPVAWGTLLSALVALPLVIAGTIYFMRAVTVSCDRQPTLTCSETETILGYSVFSATVSDIKIVRSMRPESGPQGLFAETESGENVRLSSGGLTNDQQDSLGNDIHQFIFTNQDQDTLRLERPPSLVYLAIGGALAVGLALFLLISLIRLALFWLGR